MVCSYRLPRRLCFYSTSLGEAEQVAVTAVVVLVVLVLHL